MLDNTTVLCRKLKEELPPVFSTKNILPFLSDDYASPQKKLMQLEKQGFIIRIKRGIYTFEEFCDRYLMAGFLHSPSYISYETALSYYEMIPESRGSLLRRQWPTTGNGDISGSIYLSFSVHNIIFSWNEYGIYQ